MVIHNINVMDYKHIAKKFAKKYRKLDYEDGVQDAYVQLLIKAKDFDEKRGLKFSTYAYKWTMGYVMQNQERFVFSQYKEVYDKTYNMEDTTLLSSIYKYLSEKELDILLSIVIKNEGLSELGKRYNVSNSRVHELYKRALKKTKIYLQQ
jgi:RNA polymerase sigma factor (sigma-70 family)